MGKKYEYILLLIVLHVNSNDIAIVRLADNVELSKSVGLACLPCKCLSGKDDKVFTTGWGDTEFGGKVSANLKEAAMTTAVSLSITTLLIESSPAF